MNNEGQLGFQLKKEANFINEITLNKFIIYDPLTNQKITDYEIWDIGAGDNYSLVLIRTKLKVFLVKFGIKPEDKYKDELEKICTVHIVDLDYDKIGNITNLFVFAQRSMLVTTNNDLYVGGIDFMQNPLDEDKYKHVERFNKPIKNVYLGLEHGLILDCKY